MTSNKSESGQGEGEKLRYPYSVIFILGAEFFQRIGMQGLSTILSLYLIKILGFSEDNATVIYHAFWALSYCTPILGGWIADQYLGRFKTIFLFSILCIIGYILISTASVNSLGADPYFSSMTFVGLAVLALGNGGLWPCTSTFGGDQYTLPQQKEELQTFFTAFQFVLYAAALLSYAIAPTLREVECLGETSCYPLAFGVSAALSFLSLLSFGLGLPRYKIQPPQGNILMRVVGSIGTAVTRNIAGHRADSHWMDLSKEKYGEDLVKDVKSLLRVLSLFLPFPVVFALFSQCGSRWTFQAARMDGTIGAVTIKPEQMGIFQMILTLLMLPMFNKIIYPLCAKCNILKKPLQKISVGAIICGVAFLVSGLLELQLQKTLPMTAGEANITRSVLQTPTTLASIHIFWQLPQHFLMAVTRILFMTNIMEFTYSEAPTSMKSMVQAAFLLTRAAGNLLVILVAELKLVSDQASEFFLFSGLMSTCSLVFIFLAWRFTPREMKEEQKNNNDYEDKHKDNNV